MLNSLIALVSLIKVSDSEVRFLKREVFVVEKWYYKNDIGLKIEINCEIFGFSSSSNLNLSNSLLSAGIRI